MQTEKCGHGYQFQHLAGSMGTHEYLEAPRVGIPVNLVIAALVGLVAGVMGEGIEYGISTGVLVCMMVGFIVQEALLVQLLSREANIKFQHRILSGDVNKSNRRMLLFAPLGVLLLLGFVLAILNGVATDRTTVARIVCVAVIIMFGVDPLFGLADRGVLAIFGASVVYIIILQAGFDGYDNLVSTIAPVIGDGFAFSVATSVVSYLLLSTRWTYYRLFCFNQSEDLMKAFADTGVPLLAVMLPHFPSFVGILEKMFLGL